mgnify:CR=1 FL=1
MKLPDTIYIEHSVEIEGETVLENGVTLLGNSKISKKDLSKSVEVIRSLGIEEKVRNQALKYAEKSEKSLTNYKGTAKVELVALLDFVVKRSV